MDDISWEFDQCRESLIRKLELDQSSDVHWPYWVSQFLSRHRNLTLIEAAEKVAEESIQKSNAIRRNQPPYVLLSEVARFLNARIVFASEPRTYKYMPKSGWRGNMKTSWQRGILRVSSDYSWVIRAGNRSESLTRQQVAHELGHALFYWDGERIDLRAWRLSQWSILEESLANFVGRTMLIPFDLLQDRIECNGNLAEHIVTRIASPFNVPHRVAAARWLDFSGCKFRNVVAIVEWRQYHPFNEQYIHTCLHSFTKIREQYKTFAEMLDYACPNSSYKDAITIWAYILAGIDSRRRIERRFVFSSKAMQIIENVIKFTDNINEETTKQAVRKLARSNSNTSFRPEWIVWCEKPQKAFVPFWRGSARSGSIAAILAESESHLETGIEDVSIGSLKGTFLVHGFAHGNAREGSRYILETFQEIEE